MCFVYYTQKDKDEVFTTYQQVSPQKLTLNLRPGKKKKITSIDLIALQHDNTEESVLLLEKEIINNINSSKKISSIILFICTCSFLENRFSLGSCNDIFKTRRKCT